ncbi:cytochrome P450 3A41-like [Eriocheir sinensis]|uniref:cytochrome P450 3A41-like n=1 Tax=Eriocheir sinensis TaxID=95602 RepID=UPI0021C7F9D5|nr:cytochrome P450 3A41-like [Eriocheir sinensis]XP_050716918.1 cytochrome P450 3A41-like [Eriocheir sinensis]
MGVETWLLLATVAVLAWLYSRWRHSYWASRGVASPPALPFIGHFHKSIFINKKPWEFQTECRSRFREPSMCGLYEFFKPALMVWDIEMLKHILVKDFDHFTDRRQFNFDNAAQERDKMMMEMLSVKNGPQWKGLRAIMSPTFTSGKMKSMYPLVCEKADALVKFSMNQATKQPHVDMKKNFGRFTIDTIASCAFGLECNSLVNEKAEFPRKADIFFNMTGLRLLKFVIVMVAPKILRTFNISVNPPEVDFFINAAKATIAARRAGQKRGDFLDLMLEVLDNPDNPDSKHVLSDMSLVAQCVLFIIAGYDTTASLLASSSFLLAKNKDEQQRLRDEVRQIVAEHGDLTYHGIMENKLLDACLQETLRLYPPATGLERSCTKTYTLPGTDLTLEPGDLVQVPVWGIHHDSRYWPDPDAFIPDRFLPENKSNIQPFTHIPFGMGPRNCLAMRFALMEAKVALAKLLLEAELEPAPGHENLVVTNAGGLLRPKDGVKLLLKPLKEE